MVCNVVTLKPERILALWEVFPSTQEAGRNITDLVVDSGLKLVWAASTVKKNFYTYFTNSLRWARFAVL